MRYVVNGVDSEVKEAEGVEIVPLSDRLMVRTERGAASALVVRHGDTALVSYRGRVFVVERSVDRKSTGRGQGSADARAPMPGQIVEVYVQEGEQVEAGQSLLVLEAMKMQHTVLAPHAGRVTSVPVAKGDQVADGQLLAHVEPDEAS